MTIARLRTWGRHGHGDDSSTRAVHRRRGSQWKHSARCDARPVFRGSYRSASCGGIWQAVTTDELCGCGIPFSECGFWSEVGDGGVRGGLKSIVEQMLRARPRNTRGTVISRGSSYPCCDDGTRMIWPRSRQPCQPSTLAIRSVSGCEVILDSTKDPAYAFLLNLVPEVDMRLIHLVRDSRGVAYSWQRRRCPPRVRKPSRAARHGDGPPRALDAQPWNGMRRTVSCVISGVAGFRDCCCGMSRCWRPGREYGSSSVSRRSVLRRRFQARGRRGIRVAARITPSAEIVFGSCEASVKPPS